MTNDELRDLLADAAEDAPRTDLLPGVLASARRRQLGVRTGLVGTGALAVALAATLASGVLGGATVVGVPAAPGTPPSPTAPPSPAPSSPTTTPSPQPSPPLAAIPIDAMLTAEDLPWKLAAGEDWADANITTAWGLQCGLERPKAVEPLVGRSREWGSLDGGKRGISEVALGWANAQKALQQLRTDTGRCSFIDRPGVLVDDGTTYLAQTNGFDQREVIGVRRLGNLTIGISVFGAPADSTTLLADTATKLLDIAEKRARNAGADTATYVAAPRPQPSTTTPTSPTPEPALFPIPSGAKLRLADFPWKRMTRLPDLGYMAKPTTADGLMCNEVDRPDAARPLGGEYWSWVQGSGKLSEVSVSEVITGWDDAARALDELRADKGQCVFLDPYKELSSGADRWVVSTQGEIDLVIAIQRVNHVLVAVTVYAPKGQRAAAYVQPAEKLLAAAVKRAREVGLAKR